MNMRIDKDQHRVASREEWIEASRDLVAREKELTRAHDRLAEERRALPWVRIDKDYRFQTPQGEQRLIDLFAGNEQLLIYHFMLAPGQEAGCIGCSFLLDHIDGVVVHLRNHGVSVVAVSRAPLQEIARYQSRMGWGIPWVSSHGSDFNYDFKVSFRPEDVVAGEVDYNFKRQAPWGEEASGLSAFIRNEQDEVFHSYSSFGRGGEALLPAYALLDMTPLGRREPAEGAKMTSWVRRHDEYAPQPHATQHGCCH
ncbi:MAG TPA: thioredoxin family protein [Variovorax sp.]|nr:thioredoxin family protein [Variovorax sp.]